MKKEKLWYNSITGYTCLIFDTLMSSGLIFKPVSVLKWCGKMREGQGDDHGSQLAGICEDNHH